MENKLSRKNKLRSDLKQINRDKVLYLMLAPTIIYFIIFRVLPMINMRLAFFDYRKSGDWIYAGAKYFKIIFSTPAIGDIIKNTLIISFMKYVLLFPFFVLFAILLNEIRMHRFQKFVQVISYLPHFLSWVVIAGVWISALSPSSGIVNAILNLFGMDSISFMTSKEHIRWVLMLSEGWRSLGWDSIIYFTAIISIDPSLFEAAEIDGANRMQIIRNIIMPVLLIPMTTMFILNLGFFLDAGFDQVLNFTNDSVNSVIDILDTYIYRVGVETGMYSLATAVGLIKGFIGVGLVLVTHFISKKMTGKGVW